MATKKMTKRQAVAAAKRIAQEDSDRETLDQLVTTIREGREFMTSAEILDMVCDVLREKGFEV